MPKRFSLKSVARKVRGSESGGREEEETVTIVTQPPVVTTRTLDGKIIAPGSTLPSNHKYGTVRTTQMTVVERRVVSSRPEAASSSWSASSANETSQQQSSGALEGAATQSAIGPPKPAVRKKISSQQQHSDEWTTADPMGQSSSDEGGAPSDRVTNAGSPGTGGQFGGGIGSGPNASGLTGVKHAPVPADLSAPQQLPASQTTLAGRTLASAAGRNTPTPNSRVRSPREPDELTAIRPASTTNSNPSGPADSSFSSRGPISQQPQRFSNSTQQQQQQQQQRDSARKGANPLSSALTPAAGNGNLFPSGSDEDGGSAGDEPRKHYPKKVLLIVVNEFCERFSYYGLRTVLVLYFHNVLGLTNAGSTISFHLFVALCYLTPLLGAFLGDSILGKYKTILYLSIVYFFGELILVLSSVWWDLGAWSVVSTWLALILIGVGTGGIKPCVSTFGGDQFRPSEVAWREGFFSLFYSAINLGSLVSMFVTPMLRAQNRCVGRSDCFPLAFAVPCVLMLVAILVFLLAANHYHHAPLPEKNVILAFCQCTWLALRRKLAGHKLPLDREGSGQLLSYTNPSLSDSGSNLSVREEVGAPVAAAAAASLNKQPPPSAARAMVPALGSPTDVSSLEPPGQEAAALGGGPRRVSPKRNHWLYLASDQFDTNSIEEFRCCLGLFLVFLPTPVYWALYDQQGSIWTLQATRMEGRLFNTRFVLEPDQMGVLNPLILLASIPLFHFVVYPSLARCGLLTTPLKRMAAGGFIMALTFVVSALIEFQIQHHLPLEAPLANRSNLVLVNGLNDCSLVQPQIVRATQTAPSPPPGTTPAYANSGESSKGADLLAEVESALLASLQPLSAHPLQIAAHEETITSGPQQPGGKSAYKLTFRLASSALTGEAPYILFEEYSSLNSSSSALGGAKARPTTATRTEPGAGSGCPLDSGQSNELAVGPLAGQSVSLLYVDQGNGRLGYKLFEESLALPPAGKTRVRLLYEFFGSYSQAQGRQFRLYRNSGTPKENAGQALQFRVAKRDGQVLLSEHLDVEVPGAGEYFTLMILDERGQPMASPSQQQEIFMQPGTRNLLVLHQTDAKGHKLRQEVLQDGSYKISILYQLVPYVMISFSEVLFSITALEFSYAMAPPDLKSLMMSANLLSSAFGNLLTVAIESAHLFPNIAYDFLFYALIMALDMVLFSVIAYNYRPYEPALVSQSSRARKIK